MLAAAASPPIDVADQGNRLSHLRRIEVHEPAGGDSTGKDRDETAVKTARAEAGCDRFADAPRRLIAEDDRCQHLLSAGAASARQRRARSRRAACRQCTILRRSLSSEAAASLATALTCAASAIGNLGPEANQSEASGLPAALPREIADDPGGLEPAAHCGAGERAGDQHRRVIERLRRDVGRRGPDQETQPVHEQLSTFRPSVRL